MIWMLIYFTATGPIDVYAFKREGDCFHVMMRYYDTENRDNFRCEYRID